MRTSFFESLLLCLCLSGIAAQILPDSEYEWLEPPNDPDALVWSANQTRVTIDHLDALPGSSEVLDRIVSIAQNAPTRPHFSFSGGKIFRVRYTADSGVFESTQRLDDGSVDEWHSILDLRDLSEDGSATYTTAWGNFMGMASPDGSRYILHLFGPGGTELREVDAATGEIVPGGFHVGPGVMFFTWLDIDHIIISQTYEPVSPVTVVAYPSAWQLWTRGTPLSEAPTILELAEPTAIGAFTWPLGEYGAGYALLAELLGNIEGHRFYIYRPDGSITDVLGLPQDMLVRLEMAESTSRHLAIMTSKAETVAGRDVPAGTLVAYDFLSEEEAGRVSIVWEPGPDDLTPYIGSYGLRASASRIYLTTTNDGVERILAFEYVDDSWVVAQEYVASTPGTMSELESADKYSDDVIIVEAGLIRPPSVTIRGPDEEPFTLYEHPGSFDADDFEVESFTAESRDGTIVDYLVVSPKSFDNFNSTEGRRPVLLHTYGAFGLSLELHYLDIWLVPWLEAGGSVAYAFPRGGFEKGFSWHQEAVGPQGKINTWDDLEAVAEALTESFTSPENLGFWGHSFGGLVAGVALTRMPHLFGAIISDAPVLDVLRFPIITPQGGSWLRELGDPSIPEEAEILRTWSPFHNVNTCVDYPPYLTTVANSDQVTGTGHPRKMIAKLQDAGAEAYLYVVEAGGHQVVDERINPELVAHRTSFFIHHLMD